MTTRSIPRGVRQSRLSVSADERVQAGRAAEVTLVTAGTRSDKRDFGVRTRSRIRVLCTRVNADRST